MCGITLSRSSALSGIKHLNRLEQVLARAEWKDPQIQEGLLADDTGHFIEATMSNLFLVANKQLVTPSLQYSGVAGVIRGLICERLAPKFKLKVSESEITLDEIVHADEVFLTNSIIGIWPVRQLEGHTWIRGDLTNLLQNALNQELYE